MARNVCDAHDQVLHLRELLSSCSARCGKAEDCSQAETQGSEVFSFLDSTSEAALSDPENELAEKTAYDVLSEIYQYFSSPSVHQDLVDALSFEMPKAVSKFAGISHRCLKIVEDVIDLFTALCGPRDMLSVICSALGFSSNINGASTYILPLLTGLSKVFISIPRRQFEQIRVAVPIILDVLKLVSLESDDGDLEGVFDRALGIADAIHTVFSNLEGSMREKLCALLSLYVLQCMALVSISVGYKSLGCECLVLRLSCFLSHCGVTYIDLLINYDVDAVASIVFGEDKDERMSCLSHVKHGCALSVVWGQISEEVAQAARQDLPALRDELRMDRAKRCQAMGTLKYALTLVNLPWELKKQTINLLLQLTEGNISQKLDNEQTDWSTQMPIVFSALQAVKMVIIYATEAELRKNAFELLKRILADVHTSQRLDILKALITNTDSPSMIAILLDLVRGEMHLEISNKTSNMNGVPLGDAEEVSFWRPDVLELVEIVLRPARGGPPSLPEDCDAVLSALNLYRYIFITESTRQSNYTEILCKKSLEKAYNEWLLPLRTLVTGIMAESSNDYDQLAVDIAMRMRILILFEKVAIHYYGRLAAKQGGRFGSTYDHKDENGDPSPFVFCLASENVIQGIQTAVRSMRVAGIRRVVIPPTQGYLNTSQEPVPPNFFDRQRLFPTIFNPTRLAKGEGSTLGMLMFDIELVSLKR